MQYEEALLKWGSSKLEEGFTATYVEIDTETEYGGYCETCAYESTYSGIRITGRKGRKGTEVFLRDLSLADVLGEILAITE